MIKLHLAQLAKGPVELDDELDAKVFDFAGDEILKAPNPLKFKLKATLTASGVLVQGVASTIIEGTCGRCLELVKSEIDCEYTLYFDDLSKEELDITQDIREELMLKFPMSLYCSKDCKGICPFCQVNLNKTQCKCNKKDEQKMPSVWDKLDEL